LGLTLLIFVFLRYEQSPSNTVTFFWFTVCVWQGCVSVCCWSTVYSVIGRVIYMLSEVTMAWPHWTHVNATTLISTSGHWLSQWGSDERAPESPNYTDISMLSVWHLCVVDMLYHRYFACVSSINCAQMM